MEKDTLSDIFKRNLALRMAENKVKQDKLAELVGVAQSAVSKWTNGTIPRSPQLRRIALALGCSPNDLLGWTVHAKNEMQALMGAAGKLAHTTAGSESLHDANFNQFATALGRIDMNLKQAPPLRLPTVGAKM